MSRGGSGAGLAVRWTVGDCPQRGYEALRLSIWGAWRLFGPSARYVVVVNSIPPALARERTGGLPGPVDWEGAGGRLPGFLLPRLAANLAEGVAWKLAPVRLFPDRFELALDNDCLLWERPPALSGWLEAGGGGLLAADVQAGFGVFADLCPGGPLNSGLRGLPPGLDYAGLLRETLEEAERRRGGALRLASELDEQGLQAAALQRRPPLAVVPVEDLAVCSPFWPHRPEPGRCGAHLVGLNARHLPWDYYGRPADEWRAGHWEALRDTLYRMVGAPPPTPRPPS